MNDQVWARDSQGTNVFQAERFSDDWWIGTDRENLLIRFSELKAVIEWALQCEHAYEIDSLINGYAGHLFISQLKVKTILDAAMDHVLPPKDAMPYPPINDGNQTPWIMVP